MTTINLFEITDGATTINLINNAAICIYPYDGYNPRIARTLGGGEYETVQDVIRFRIKGTTGTQVLERLNQLSQLVEQARRFALGERVAPVVLRFQQTVTSAIFTVLVFGGNVNAPANFVQQENWKVLFPVTVELERRGRWVTPSRSSLILNGSFENWTGTDPETPDNWTAVQGSSAQITKNTNLSFVTSGLRSLKLDPDTGAGEPVVEITQEISSATIAPGLTARVLMDVYVTADPPSGSLPFLAIAVYGAGFNSQLVGDTGGEFRTIELLMTSGVYSAPPITDGIRVNLTMLDVDNIVAYVDNIRVSIFDEVSGAAGDVATDTAVDNGDVALLPFANVSEVIPSPTLIQASNVRVGSRHTPAFVVVANQPDALSIIDAGDLTLTGTFSQVADTATFAYGGNVARYTPTNTAWRGLQFLSFVTGLFGTKWISVFLVVRNNSATTSFFVRGRSSTPTGAYFTEPVLIAPQATARPETVYIGKIPITRKGRFIVEFQADAAADTLDIDRFVVAKLDDGLVHIVKLDQGQNDTGASLAGLLTLNHNELTGMLPEVQISETDNTFFYGASGNIAVSTKSAQPEAILIATGGAANANRWRQTAGTTEAVIANDWTASRLPARLTPQ